MSLVNQQIVAGENLTFRTPELPAGRYKFSTTGSGDIDLYVKAGMEASTSVFDCGTSQNGSEESCVVELRDTAVIHGILHGWDALSTVSLTGEQLPD